MTRPDVHGRRNVLAEDIINMELLDCVSIELDIADGLERFER